MGLFIIKNPASRPRVKNAMHMEVSGLLKSRLRLRIMRHASGSAWLRPYEGVMSRIEMGMRARAWGAVRDIVCKREI